LARGTGRVRGAAARVGGSRLVAKANVAAGIRAGLGAQQRPTRVRADAVLREIAEEQDDEDARTE
jgi:hypothetical protein